MEIHFAVIQICSSDCKKISHMPQQYSHIMCNHCIILWVVENKIFIQLEIVWQNPYQNMPLILMRVSFTNLKLVSN